MSTAPIKMTHQFLGNSGLLVSKLALGSWMQYDEKYTVDMWYEMTTTALEHGVNFIDTTEEYGMRQSKTLLGGAIKKGVNEGIFGHEDLGNTRKHILEGTQASLRRLDLDYVDVIFCHRPDPFTPIEETVRAMNYVINKGWAFYWGTTEWLPSQIHEACEIADRRTLIRPIVEQSQYNIFERSRVEYAYVDLYYIVHHRCLSAISRRLTASRP
ncbi:hypothetical protein L917_03107 [Phytophthora nicotianae]|uniref:NADP-dependent oxidoreductase domain-containing protein n=1 Tax=Phytophthora nicotianae TaxID=4792 RepID=W2LRZ0_PHYNI|nr:hypothetical protein L917_03107 [Phytophthora nicotianae]